MPSSKGFLLNLFNDCFSTPLLTSLKSDSSLVGFILYTSCGGRKVKILQTDIYANPSLSPSRGLGCKSKLCAIKLANCTPVGYITNVRATETSKALSDLLLNPNGVMGCLGMAKLFTPLPFNYIGIRRGASMNHTECDIYIKFWVRIFTILLNLSCKPV